MKQIAKQHTTISLENIKGLYIVKETCNTTGEWLLCHLTFSKSVAISKFNESKE